MLEYKVSAYLHDLEDRISRLETLEAAGGGGGVAGDIYLIESKVLTVQGGLQFTNIASTVKHIFFTGFLRSVGGASYGIVINGSAQLGDISTLSVAGCGSSGGPTTSGNVRVGFAHNPSGVGSPANMGTPTWGFIPDIQTAYERAALGESGNFYRDDYVHALQAGRGGGTWDTVGPITQIDIVHDAGNQFAAGTEFSLYGLDQ